MRFNVIALSVTAALLWGAAVLIVASVNMVSPPYGRAFLEVVASIYPGYHVSGSVGSVITGALYALVDGAIGGVIFGWVYNFVARQFPNSAA